MARLNISLTGSQITDEIINRANSTSSKLAHDTIRFVALDFEIWTGAAKTGTKLVITTDYVLGGQDTDYSAEAGVPVYTTIAIVNGARQNINLYVTYKTCGDYASVENVAEIGSLVMAPLIATIGVNTTYTLPFIPGERKIYIPKSFLKASTANTYTLTITTGVAGKDNVTIPIQKSTDTITSGNFLAVVYIDSAGNVTSDGWKISGSNSNGNWQIDADGTMEQWNNQTTSISLPTINNTAIGLYSWSFYYGSKTFIFPTPFVGSLPHVAYACEGGIPNIQDLAFTSFNATPYSQNQQTITTPWHAKGRWRV